MLSSCRCVSASPAAPAALCRAPAPLGSWGPGQAQAESPRGTTGDSSSQTQERVRGLLHYGKCALRVLISTSSGGDAAHPQQLEVKDLKGQSRWQLSSTFHHAAAEANALLSSAFVFAHHSKAEKGIHA